MYKRQLPGLAQESGNLSTSLRVYDEAGHLLAQQDGGFLPQTGQWIAGSRQTQTLSLPLPVALAPGDYTINLLVYLQTDGQPLTFTFDQKTSAEFPLGTISVQSPTRPVDPSTALARFDYIDLVSAEVARAEQAAAEGLDVRLVWQPRARDYRDTYAVTLELVDEAGTVAAQWTDALGGWAYPSGMWPASVPVLDWKHFMPDPRPAPGLYTLTLSVSRAADGQPIPARTGIWPRGDTLELGSIRLR